MTSSMVNKHQTKKKKIYLIIESTCLTCFTHTHTHTPIQKLAQTGPLHMLYCIESCQSERAAPYSGTYPATSHPTKLTGSVLVLNWKLSGSKAKSSQPKLLPLQDPKPETMEPRDQWPLDDFITLKIDCMLCYHW